ncbi:MAG: Sulfoxide reductase catalytic subunit YedY [Acidobacteria bacterium]|nr:Sulfoxide reductase catalytic subunit YedY [Acidobacteriota bacterium]
MDLLPGDYFPLWVRLTHFFNFLFITLLMRSGIEIIGTHPKFYWNDDCLTGSEWLKFTKRRMPENELWTAEDEIVPLNSWIAMPGRNNLGLGRHWHFWSTAGWIITGVVYVVCLFASSEWRRLVPTSWEIFPNAWNALTIYLQLRLPPDGHPFNPLQQLSYFGLIFILTPIQIITGIAMSPALAARFPWILKIFGGRQGVRSVHFLGLCLYVLFTIGHISLVIWHGFGPEMAKIVLGYESDSHSLAIKIGLAGIAAVIVYHVAMTLLTLRQPKMIQKRLEIGIDRLRYILFHRLQSRQNYNRRSSYARVNGRPPRDATFQKHLATNFEDFRLEIHGLVEHPLSLSLDHLRGLSKKTQTTLHTCIQGWTYFAQWGGVSVAELIEMCVPAPEAKYLVFRTMDDKWEVPGRGHYYEVIDLTLARKPQTILAYEMNNEPLPLNHGAPLRLRVESQLGYKMAKWVCAIEFVESFAEIGQGQGGWRDDVLNYYRLDAGI